MDSRRLAREAGSGSRFANVVFIGFMIFATFFGAGNMIFPAYLGVVGGTDWLPGLIGFIIGDACLGVLALAASACFPRAVMGAYYRVGYGFMVAAGSIGLFVGSVLSVIPRTAGVTLENGLAPVLSLLSGNQGLPSLPGPAVFIPFFALYMGLACLCVIHPAKIIDILGRFLTPALIIMLFVLYIMGYIAGDAGVRPGADAGVLAESGASSMFAFGLNEGYQTTDSFTGALFALVIVNALMAKKYVDPNEQQKMIYLSGVIGCISCFILYLGLTGLGVIHSASPQLQEMAAAGDRTGILNYIVRVSLGTPGIIVLALVVLMATFTTAVGSGSMVATFFSTSCKKYFGGKLSYERCTLICFSLAFIIVCVMYINGSSGVARLISFMYPFMLISTPMLCGCIMGTLIGRRVKNDNIVRGALIGAFIPGLAETVVITATMLFNVSLLETSPNNVFSIVYTFFNAAWNLPAQAGLSFLIPSFAGMIIGAFIPWKGRAERPYLREHAGQLNLDYDEALAEIKA
jgi:LIVCS family branched-chain amino acid:cation transporter